MCSLVCRVRRCVVVVGLPYPNPRDPELLARMKFIDQRMALIKESRPDEAAFNSKRYYTSLCMKAVNQSIGT